MLFATDKFTLSFGDTAKLTIQYENTTLTNTGKKQAIVEASKDGYTWAQVASIAPESSLPLKIEALYVRLTTDTTVSVVNTDPIPRDTKKSDIAVNINTEALVIKDDLQAYVSKQELNDLVHHPDLSDYVTTRQLQDAIPEVPTPPDISGLASKESVATKADQTVVDDLKLTVATKADATALVALRTRVTDTIIPAINHLNEIKADKTELDTLAEQVAQSKATVGTLATQVTGFQSALDDRVTKEQAEDANRVLLNAIAGRATTEQLNTLHEEVEQKANQQQVDELTNKALSLEQDKANRADLESLTDAVKLIQTVIGGDIDGDLLDQTKAEIIESLNQSLPDVIKGLIPDSLGQEELAALETKLTEYITAETNKKADQSHTHTMSDVTGLAEALADKSDAAHSHTWASISGKPSSFIPSDHTHLISEVTGLQEQLDSKVTTEYAEGTYAKKSELPQPVDLSGYATKQSVDSLSQTVNALSGTGDVDLTGLATKEELNSKANTEHTHSMTQITGLQEALNTKVSTEQLTTALSQVNIAPQGWQVLTTRQNLNTMTTQGKYLIRIGSNTNAPITNWIYVVVEVAASDRITQTVWADGESHLMFIRVYNGTWRPWEKLTLSKELLTKANAQHSHTIAEITDLQPTLDTLRAEVEELKKLEPTGGSGSEVTNLCYPSPPIKPYNTDLEIFFEMVNRESLHTNEYLLREDFHAVKGSTSTLSDGRWKLEGKYAAYYYIRYGKLYTHHDPASLVATHGRKTSYTEVLTLSHPDVLLGLPITVKVIYTEYLPD